MQVKLFAILRDAAGVGEVALDLPDRATVQMLGEHLSQKFPAIAGHLPRVAYAVNREYASRDIQLHDGDEVALIPPVSGG